MPRGGAGGMGGMADFYNMQNGRGSRGSPGSKGGMADMFGSMPPNYMGEWALLPSTVYTLRRVLYSYVCVMRHRRPQSVVPPTAVGGAPIANAAIILSGLVYCWIYFYNQSGVFYFPWHRRQVDGTYRF